jgi:hypothetical protein
MYNPQSFTIPVTGEPYVAWWKLDVSGEKFHVSGRGLTDLVVAKREIKGRLPDDATLLIRIHEWAVRERAHARAASQTNQLTLSESEHAGNLQDAAKELADQSMRVAMLQHLIDVLEQEGVG